VSTSVQVDGVGVRFIFDRQQRPVTPTAARLRGRCTSAWGLQNVTVSIGPGESVALIGPNGAGKTTLLRTMARVLYPDRGTLQVNGRVGSLLSVEAGLTGALTGRENAILLGVIGGQTRSRARREAVAIGARSELGKAFDRPVSTYSHGMRARLGFAAVEHSEPEVLLLDEVYEALDEEFRSRVEERARELIRVGGIVVAAGHDHPELGRLCGRALALDGGRVSRDGSFAEVVDSGVRPLSSLLR
jgi:ABC-type polysaccharide/polyol phosphate transport system ATPase subunit